MASPIHAVHTIHGTFSGLSTYPIRFPPQLSSYSPYAGVVMDMSDRQAPGLAKGSWRVAPVSVPPSCRRLSPPPPRGTTGQPVHFPHADSNPFDEHHALLVPPASQIQTMQLLTYQRTRLASQSSSFTVKIPRPSHVEALVRQRTAQRLAQDREARCKAVAGILLNRVHAVGKPMRRAPPLDPDVPRTYKRSRLSTMVTVNDL